MSKNKNKNRQESESGSGPERGDQRNQNMGAQNPNQWGSNQNVSETDTDKSLGMAGSERPRSGRSGNERDGSHEGRRESESSRSSDSGSNEGR